MKTMLTLILLGTLLAGCSSATFMQSGPAAATAGNPSSANPGIMSVATEGRFTQEAPTSESGLASSSLVMTVNSPSIMLTPVQGNAAGQTPTPSIEGSLVDLAKQDLATRLKINIDQITVRNVTKITGADLSSGCILKAGQVLMPDQAVDGYQIALEAAGQAYLYHAGSNNQLVLCQNMNPTAKP